MVLVMLVSSVCRFLKLSLLEAEGDVHAPRVSSDSNGSLRRISSASGELPLRRNGFAGDSLIDRRCGSPLVSHFHLTRYQKHLINLSFPPVDDSRFSQHWALCWSLVAMRSGALSVESETSHRSVLSANASNGLCTVSEFVGLGMPLSLNFLLHASVSTTLTTSHIAGEAPLPCEAP